MLYSDFEGLISPPRMSKYLAVCENNTRKAMTLYRANIRLSTEMFSILCLFEVALRNKIDRHYRTKRGNNWLFEAVQPGTGFLHSAGCEKSLETVQKVITNLGASYSPDKAVAELTFGFWAYQFASKEFAAAGNSLLQILPGRPFGTNYTKVFKKLTSINRTRNRIAHHEPICFAVVASVDGFIAKRDNSVSWFETEDTYDKGVTGEDAGEVLKTIDCYVMGARTYEHAVALSQSYGWAYGDTPAGERAASATVRECLGRGGR